MGPRFWSARSVFIVAVALSYPLFSARADKAPTLGSFETKSNAEATPNGLARLTISPMSLSGGSSLTVISPQAWSTLSALVETTLESTHHRLANLFGELPPVSASIRLMTTDAFTRATGAPEWTNALYVRGQILIPIGAEQLRDHHGVTRSVSHEYTHAVISALSRGRAPGWLDEGLAQWIEGEENPILKPALYEWLSKNAPIPLSKLQGGFTRLLPETVPAAYAQSLLSATVVLNTYGFAGVRKFFNVLAEGGSQDEALELAFQSSSQEFETRLNTTLARWLKNQQRKQAAVKTTVARPKTENDTLINW